MTIADNEMLIGLNEAVDAIIEVGEKCQKCYRHCGATPPPILIDLAKHNGQSTLTRFYSKVLKQTYGLPSGGLDDYLEFSVNGDMKALKDLRRKLTQAAVYTNTYRGVVSFDITGLAEYINESQIEFFHREVLWAARDACLLFYVAPEEMQRMAKLIADLSDTVGNFEVVHVSPYTTTELAKITEANIRKLGISVNSEADDVFSNLMQEVIQNVVIHSAKETELVAKRLAEYADYSAFRPVFGLQHLRNALNYYSDDRGESYHGER